MLYSLCGRKFSTFHFLLAVIFNSSGEIVRAAPSSGYGLSSRQTNDTTSNANLSPQVWIPITIIAVLFVSGALLMCSRRGWFGRLSNWATGAAIASGTVIRRSNDEAPREITADQLAGTDNTRNNATANTTPNATTRPARRPRRTRRTPSQISTTSLPAYMKEPGEQELVVIRGPEDMEDAPTTVVEMPLSADTTLGLDSSDSTLREDISRTNSHSPEYDEVPNSPHDQPLLHPDNSPLDRRPSQRSLRRVSTRPSYDTLLSSSEDADSAALVQAHPVPPALIDTRGAAPPYFEVVSMDDLSRNISITTDSHQHSPSEALNPEPSPPPAQNTGSRIRTSIMNLFSPRGQPTSAPPVPPLPSSSQLSPNHVQGRSSHARSESGPSIMSIASTGEGGGSRLSHVRSRSRPTTPGHRPSHSGTNSVFSISSNFRPLSRARSRSQNRLNAEALTSPSLISLNSISAPLTHTAIKTSLVYPKGGPTADQMKLIASRESFAKFGLPYGPDAVAFASHSRVDLSMGPPPGFEEVVTSNQADSSGEASGSGSQDTTNEEVPQDVVETDSPIPITESPVEVSPASPMATHTVTDTDATLHLSPSSSLPVPQSASAAPSAFKDPSSATLPRAESRASSYLSFATAEESLHSSGDFAYHQPNTPATPATPLHLITSPTGPTTPTIVIPQDDDIRQDGQESKEDVSRTPSTTNPPTPTMSSRHIHESTDTNVIVSAPTPTSPTAPHAL